MVTPGHGHQITLTPKVIPGQWNKLPIQKDFLGQLLVTTGDGGQAILVKDSLL